MEKINKADQAIFAALLSNPPVVRLMAVIGLIHFTLAYFGISGWVCPLFQATGVPCPGCGLTRATSAMLVGDWGRMKTLHIFAPVFLAVLAIFGIISFLQDELRETIISRIELIELRTKASLLFLLCLLVYWGLRLILDPTGYIALMAFDL
jgi:hypothetical protein